MRIVTLLVNANHSAFSQVNALWSSVILTLQAAEISFYDQNIPIALDLVTLHAMKFLDA